MEKMRFGYKIWTVIITFVLTSFLFNAGSLASLYYAGISLLSYGYQTLLFAGVYFICRILYSLNDTFFHEYVLKKYVNKRIIRNLEFVMHRFNNMSMHHYSNNIGSGQYLSSIRQNYYWPFYSGAVQIYYFSDIVLTLLLNLGFFFLFNWILGIITLLGIFILFIPGTLTYKKWDKWLDQANTDTNNWFEKMFQLFKSFNFYYANSSTNKIIDKTQTKLWKLQMSEKSYKSIEIIYGFIVGLIFVIIEITYYMVSGFSLIKTTNEVNKIVGLSFFSIANLPNLLTKARLFPDAFFNFALEKNIYTKFWNFSDGDQYPENQLTQYEQPFETINVEKLSFNYPDKPNLFKNFNLTIEKNKKYLLIGNNGSGKSTLTKLLIGAERDYSGRILLNNDIEIRQLKQASLGHYFNLVTNKNILLDDTLRNNITLYQEGFSDEQIKSSLNTVNLSELNQLDHVYEQSKNGLSVGQVQRLDIARCLLEPKPILILDEALSNVDVPNQERILNHFLAQKDLTLIVITHHLNPAWQQRFDQVVQL